MNRKKRNKVLLTLGSLSFILGTSSIFFFNSFSNENYKFSYSKNLSKISLETNETGKNGYTKNNNTNIDSIQNHIVPLNLSDNNIPKQNTVYDLTNSSYATLTSSQEYKKNQKENTAIELDQITKFSMQNSFSEQNGPNGKPTQISTAGKADWIVKLSDLAALIQTSKNGSSPSLKIQSIMFSPGGQQTSKSLFVLTKENSVTTSNDLYNSINSNYYLFEIVWEKFQDKESGSYRLVKKITSSQNGNNFSNELNTLVLESSATHTLQILSIPNIENSVTNTNQLNEYVDIDFITLNNAEFDGGGELKSKKTIKLNKGFFENNKKYSPLITLRKGDTLFSILKQTKTNNVINNEKNTPISILKIPGINDSSNTITIDLMNTTIKQGENKGYKKEEIIKNIESESSIFSNDFSVSSTAFNINDEKFNLFFSPISKSNKTNEIKNKIASLSLNISSIFNSSSEQLPKIVEHDYLLNNSTSIQEDFNIRSVKESYKPNSDLIDGYLILDSENKIVKIDQDKKNPKVLYDFKNSSLDLGEIYNIVTRRTNNSWFAQLSDSSFAQFIGSTLIGQWDKLSSSDSYEIPASIQIKSSSELDQKILYQQIYNDDSSNENTNFTASFKSFFESPNAYKNFMSINYTDPRVNSNPQIKIEVENKKTGTPDGSRIYDLTFIFKQTLRKISPNGSISSNDTKDVEIGRQTYRFNNSASKVEFAFKDGTENKDFPVPAYIKNKLPSQITHEEVTTYLVRTENVPNATISYTPNDQKGSMTISVHAPIYWEQSGTSYSQREYNETVIIDGYQLGDGEILPFFKDDKYGVSGKVTVIDDKYFADNKNSTLVNNLTIKYSDKLASQLTKQEYLDNFVIFGSAFNDTSNDDLIKPGVSDIKVTPNDKEGNALIDLNIPKIGREENVRFLFKTPSIFVKNETANMPIYFSFKSNSQVLATAINAAGVQQRQQNTLSNRKPTEFASLLNGNNGENKVVTLKLFAEFSTFFENYLISSPEKLTAEADDSLGSLTINLDIKGLNIEGFNQDFIRATFTGFNGKSTQSEGDQLTFNNFSNISNLSPTDITEGYILSNEIISFGKDGKDPTKMKERTTITLNPSRTTGTLEVNATVRNFVEKGTDGQITVYPSKTFTKIFTGFLVTKTEVDLVGFRSFNEFVEVDANTPINMENTPSLVKRNIYSKFSLDESNSEAIKSQGRYDALRYFTNISEDLLKKLSPSNVLRADIEPDDNKGTLEISFTILYDGVVSRISNKYSGLRSTNANNVTITFSQDPAALSPIMGKLPSQITVNDIGALYTINNNSENNTVKVTLGPDDATGTLSIKIEVFDPSGKLIGGASNQQTFSGFAKFVPNDKGTNWGIVAASFIVPVILLLIPIIIVGYVFNVKDRKKIAAKLDRRLSEEYKKKRKFSLGS